MSPAPLPFETRVINMDYVVADLERADHIKAVVGANELRPVSRAEIIRRAIRLGLGILEKEYGIESPSSPEEKA